MFNPNFFKMKKIRFLLMIFSLISFSLISCGDDDNADDSSGNVYTGPDCLNSYSSVFDIAAEEMSSAAFAYGMDSTLENCNAYRTAAQSFLDEVKPFENCTDLSGTDRDNFLLNIQNAEEVLETPC